MFAVDLGIRLLLGHGLFLFYILEFRADIPCLILFRGCSRSPVDLLATIWPRGERCRILFQNRKRPGPSAGNGTCFSTLIPPRKPLFKYARDMARPSGRPWRLEP